MRSFWRRFRRRFRSLARMPWSDKALLAESLGMLAAARLLIKTAPGKRLVSRMGGAPVDQGGTAPDAVVDARTADGDRAVRVGAMLERVARITVWRSMCLEKALAGKWMLRRRG